MKLSKYFYLDDLTKSNYADKHDIENIPDNEEVVKLKDLCFYGLDPICEHFGKLIVTSGYRSIELNKALKGAKNSQHTKGEAVDFVLKNYDHYKACKIIEASFCFDQLILEPNWIHISFKFDENRREVLTRTNNGYVKGLVKP